MTKHTEPDASASHESGGSDSPSSGKPLMIVGIGASAGGLAALKAFFDNVPAESGLAFVVVVHLSPEHESHLADLLQPHAKMPVQQVAETIAIEPNKVYVIPPGCNLSAIDTHLRLSSLEKARRERAPVDHFFRTLAATHDGESAGVILSGSGSDGTLGIKEIKARGGLTIVQDLAEAQFDGMPQSAISTGLVDLVLPVARIPSAIIRYSQTQPQLVALDDAEEVEAAVRNHLHKIFGQIRARTGRDFSRYKRSTILRRIGRRMQIHTIEQLDGYLDYLRGDPDEVRALADDLLITVTSFFRDPESCSSAWPRRSSHSCWRRKAREARYASGPSAALPAKKPTRWQCCCSRRSPGADRNRHASRFSPAIFTSARLRGLARPCIRETSARMFRRRGWNGSLWSRKAGTGSRRKCASW